MTEHADLPGWWDELVDWLCESSEVQPGEGMIHARRVFLYWNEVCNGGMWSYFGNDDRGFSDDELAVSMRRVCNGSSSALYAEALNFYQTTANRHPLPKEAWGARSLAADRRSRGDSDQEIVSFITLHVPQCPSSLHDAVLASLKYDEELSKVWEQFDDRFYADRDALPMQLATYADARQEEWRGHLL